MRFLRKRDKLFLMILTRMKLRIENWELKIENPVVEFRLRSTTKRRRNHNSRNRGKLPKTNYSIFALQKQRGTVVQMSHGGLVAFLLYVNQEKNVIMFQFLKNAIAGVRFCPQRPQGLFIWELRKTSVF